MNRATRYVYDKFDREYYARSFAIGIERYPEIYKKLKKAYRGIWKGCLNPAHLIKYLIRQDYLFQYNKRVTLAQLKDKIDPYQEVKIWKFNGKFSFDNDAGGFVPMYRVFQGSLWVKQFYRQKEEATIKNAWNEAKKFLSSPNGLEPILIHEFEKPHVYFMQDMDNKEIRIGVSIHPQIRKKQHMRDRGHPIEILHIISSAGYEEEIRLHRQFRDIRVKGEWFQPAPKLLEFIKKKQNELS